MDLKETKARESVVVVGGADGKRERINVTWRPEHKAKVEKYANALGFTFGVLAEKLLKEHVAAEAKKRRWKNISNVKAILKRLAGKQAVSGHVRYVILWHIDQHPLRDLPPAPKTEDLELIKRTRPEALVYILPVAGARIITAPDGEGGWRGVVFDPIIVNSASAWHSKHINPPTWAKTPTVLKAMSFVASRIDMDGMCYFELPGTKIKISARWDGKRFEEGLVIEGAIRQSWQRGGWYGHMQDPKGPFNLRPNVRRMINMLCRTMTVGGGGLTANVPAN